MQQSLSELGKALKLAKVPRIYQDVPFNEPEQYLTSLFAEKIKARQLKKIDRLIKTAGFVNTKSLENFD